ncbi:MAG TPA: D-alanine--D-alanine ligase family protein [Thermoanaerobaculia bacterium]|nr:D-alanine--D-alanine ligase family protein [Thermoanaerobaculia bacterium]
MSHVGVVFGGRSVEHQVSVASARTVARGLREAGHQVTPLGIAQDGCWLDRAAAAALLAGEEKAIPPLGVAVAPTLVALLTSGVEVVFPIVHGSWGEDGTLQGLCEMLDLPYVGPGVTASAVAIDKLFTKHLLAAAGVPVLPCEAVTRADFERDPRAFLARLERLPLPLFVKPRSGGSSVGVKRLDHRECAETTVRFALQFDDAVLVERGIAGRELECAVLGYERIEASAVGEVVPGNQFYDYADKYLQDTARLLAPADLPPATAERIRTLAVNAFAALGGVGMARVDFLLEGDGSLFVNELNTLPGFTAISMYPRLWELAGVPLPQLTDRLVAIAIARHRDRRRLDDAIKSWLEEL